MSDETQIESSSEAGPDHVISTFAEYVAECRDELEALAEKSYPISPIARDVLDQLDEEETC